MSAALVIFDVDGVLVDTLAANLEAYQHACRQMALPLPGAEAIRSLLGRSAEETGALGCPPERIEEFVQVHAWPRYEQVVMRGVPTFPRVPALLTTLRGGGVRMAAWTCGLGAPPPIPPDAVVQAPWEILALVAPEAGEVLT